MARVGRCGFRDYLLVIDYFVGVGMDGIGDGDEDGRMKMLWCGDVIGTGKRKDAWWHDCMGRLGWEDRSYLLACLGSFLRLFLSSSFFGRQEDR